HRVQAGLRIGTNKHVDLLRYTAWLVHLRHAPKSSSSQDHHPVVDLEQIAADGAALASQGKLSRKQELVLGALLTETNLSRVADQTGVGRTTIHRWMKEPQFRSALRQTRRELVESAIGQLQAASAQAVETLITVARKGRRDGDRVRAAMALLDHAYQGLQEQETLHGVPPVDSPSPMSSADVVELLGTRLRQLDRAHLSTPEKARLTASLSDALLRAMGVDVLDKRLEALQTVLLTRKKQS
ncbi:MAG: hypothetical protein JNJ77_21650, partial [Planctomycetia bacterium]|nr:hypothetical protein [Planctomycetia bacterium]